MRIAIARGLATADFETMSIGMIIDYLVTCQNADIEAQNGQQRATQQDIDVF